VNWVFAIGGLLLLSVAAYSVWRAFRSPKFIGKLTQYASKQVWNAVKPELTRPMPADETKDWHKAIRRGDDSEFQRKRRGAPPKG
jgi:hypothetical protein